MSVDPGVASESGPSGGSTTLRAVQRWLIDRPSVALVGVLVALLVITNIVSPGFLTARQLSTTVLFAAPLALLAAGQTLVMLTGGVDLSVANTATAAAYILAYQGTEGTPRAVLAALAVGLAVGLINGIGVAVFGVQPLIMTLGMAGVLVGTLTVANQKLSTRVPLVPGAINTLGSGRTLSYIPDNLYVWAPVSLLIILGLRYSGFGRMLYAVGDNVRACRLAGVRVWQVLLVNYVLCGVLSAVAGILLVGYTDAADLALANSYLLPSVAAVVIGGTSILGGTGGYLGTILGALILTVLDSLLTLLNASAATQQMLYGAIILALAWVYARTAGAE